MEPFVSFDCIAEGSPKPHLSWLFDGERLLLNQRTKIQRNGTIFIHDVQSEDAGQYTCVAENINGKITASVTLEIMGKRVFLMYFAYLRVPIYRIFFC